MKKINFSSEKMQQLYLSQEGYVIESCDTLFSTDFLKNNSLKAQIPFLESLWPVLLQPEERFVTEYSFDAVFLEIGSIKGYFDVRLIKIYMNFEKGCSVYFLLRDSTKEYLRKRKRQQKENEREILIQVTNKDNKVSHA